MGKSKVKRAKIRNNNPTGIPSIKDLEECEELSSTNFETGTIETVIEKLQSRGADDKECAAFTIANMANNPKFVASLIKEKVIRIAAPFLLDHNPAVRHAMAGCLRNVAACGDHSVLQAMVDQDVMTSLVALLLQYKEPWTPLKSLEDKIDSKSEIFLEACNLLWSLCESSDTAVTIFNKRNLISVLLPCLNVEVFGLQIPLAVAHCLHTVSEDNSPVIEALSEPLVQEQLKAVMSLTPVEAEHGLLKTLAAGIMTNIFSGKLNKCMSDVTASILEVIKLALSEPIDNSLNLLSEQITSHKIERANKYHEDKDLEEKAAAVLKTLKVLQCMLSAKQISLEILANVCFDDDSNGEWDDLSSSDASEIAEMDVDETSVTPMKLGLRVPCEIHGIIVNGKLLQSVIEQIVVPADEMLKIISENSSTQSCIKKLNDIRCRALLCLSNVVQGLDLEELGGPSKLFELWLNVANLLFNKTDMSNTEQLEAATSCMRAILQKMAEDNCASHFSHMTNSDLELLINICNQCHDPGIKVNIIQILGTLGCLLGKLSQPSSHRLINVIGTVLLETCSKVSDLWVTAEALDAIMDVFAEDDTDPIAQEISLVEKLTHLVPFLKGRIKQQRKSLGEHFPVIITAKTNLLRFIKYKKDQNKK